MDIFEIKTGDEINCQRAKLTEDKVLVLRDGFWVELRPQLTTDMRLALRFMSEYLRYHMCWAMETEPHETMTDYAKQEHVLECTGCSAHGVSRWTNGWKKEFTHEPDCRWLKFLATMRDVGIDLPISEKDKLDVAP
jgi:hypothetical protein